MKETTDTNAFQNPDAEFLIKSNLRLVLKIANDFLGRGLPWDDLVAEGNRGLMNAAHHYDPQVGAKFSTYSAYWIKQAINSAIADQVQTVRVPIGTQQNSRRIDRCVRTLETELGRSPTDEEVAEAAKLPLVTIQRLRGNRQVDMQSLNDIIGDENDGTELQEFFADPDTPPPDMALRKMEDLDQLFTLLETLSEREKQVLQMRFGLNGETVRTLEEVGKKLNCTSERIRQIQNEALNKLHDLMTADNPPQK